MKGTIVCLILFVVLATNQVSAEDWHAEMAACDFVIQGNYAYVASYMPGLRIFDISDPLHPQMVGSCYNDSTTAWYITLNDTIAYISFQSRLRVVDISNPETPDEIGYCDSELCFRSEIAYSDDYLFAVIGNYDDWSFVSIDVSDPASPVVSGSWADEEEVLGEAIANGPLRIKIRNNYAFLTGFDGGNRNPSPGTIILDISDPENPDLIAQIDNHRGDDLFLIDNLLYILGFSRYGEWDDSWGLAIFDISDIDHIQYLSGTRAGDYKLFIKNNYAYTIYETGGRSGHVSGGISVIDISDPYSPEGVSNYEYIYVDFISVGSQLYVNDTFLFYGNLANFGICELEDVMEISDTNIPTPTTFQMTPAYPNPFNGQTTVTFTLPQAGSVNLTMFDMLGREVSQLTPGSWLQSGEHHVNIDADKLATGNYLLRLQSDNDIQVQPITLMK